jgi:hypothetical protein
MWTFNFFNLPNPALHNRPLGLPETKKEVFLGIKAPLVHKADSFTAICESHCPDNLGSSLSHNPVGLHSLWKICTKMYDYIL